MFLCPKTIPSLPPGKKNQNFTKTMNYYQGFLNVCWWELSRPSESPNPILSQGLLVKAIWRSFPTMTDQRNNRVRIAVWGLKRRQLQVMFLLMGTVKDLKNGIKSHASQGLSGSINLYFFWFRHRSWCGGNRYWNQSDFKHKNLHFHLHVLYSPWYYSWPTFSIHE